MTREQARKIVLDKMRNLEGREYQGFVNALEALGLIKFEEERQWWKNSSGNYCEFSQGFDPNTVSDIDWWKVTKPCL